jgi:hypothetical protein
MTEDMSSNGVCLTEVVTGPDEVDDNMSVEVALKRNNSTLQQNFKQQSTYHRPLTSSYCGKPSIFRPR